MRGRTVENLPEIQNYCMEVFPEKENHYTILLTLCMLGNFSCFCSHLLTFFIFNFFKKIFQQHYQSVKWFRFRSVFKDYQQRTKEFQAKKELS